MDSNWDPDWDTIVELPLSEMRIKRPPRLRNRTRSEPTFKPLIPDRLISSGFDASLSLTGAQLALCREKGKCNRMLDICGGKSFSYLQ